MRRDLDAMRQRPSDDDTITPLMVPDRFAVLDTLNGIRDAVFRAIDAVASAGPDDLPGAYARTLVDVVNAFVDLDAAFAPPPVDQDWEEPRPAGHVCSEACTHTRPAH